MGEASEQDMNTILHDFIWMICKEEEFIIRKRHCGKLVALTKRHYFDARISNGLVFNFSRIVLTPYITEPLNDGPDFIPFGKLYNIRLHVEIEKIMSNTNFVGITIPLWKAEASLHKGNRIKRTNLPQRLIIAMNNLNRF
ncbi:hypothetical protein ACOME3_002279 [Neoechinorhynchus agilis]